jgi:hypothetical protein
MMVGKVPSQIVRLSTPHLKLYTKSARKTAVSGEMRKTQHDALGRTISVYQPGLVPGVRIERAVVYV